MMDFMPWPELQRRLRQARRTRIDGLLALGRSREDATAQVNDEFSHYDRHELDDRGWVRIPGLDLDETADV